MQKINKTLCLFLFLSLQETLCTETYLIKGGAGGGSVRRLEFLGSCGSRMEQSGKTDCESYEGLFVSVSFVVFFLSCTRKKMMLLSLYCQRPGSMVWNSWPVKNVYLKMYIQSCSSFLFVVYVYYENENMCIHSSICWGIFL